MEFIFSFVNATKNYSKWLLNQINLDSNSLYGNYFWALGIISILFFLLEIIIPWRKNQALFSKGFWLDAFYMYFNFFIFYLVLFAGLQNTGDLAVKNLFSFLGIENEFALKIQGLNLFWKSVIALVIQDFTHWNIHRMLHSNPFLWRFHKVHHSAKEMGFATHLRFHWVETIIYKAITFMPLYLFFGFNIEDFFFLHLFTIIWGHFNHANILIPLGPLKYIFNSPQMHIWHHAKVLPKQYTKGVNFGLTLSTWDYLFKTAYNCKNGKNQKLGFKGDSNYPENFTKQLSEAFKKTNKSS